MNAIATVERKDVHDNPVGQSKLIKASENYLSRRHPDMEILEKDIVTPYGSIDIVAKDEQALHIIVVTSSDEGGFVEPDIDRETFEQMAIHLLEMNRDMADTPITFDHIGFRTMGPDRALMRFHQNILTFN